MLKQVHQECMIPFSLSTCLSGVLHLFLICFKLFFGSFLHFDLCFTLLIKSIRFVSFDSSHICILYMFKNCVRTDLLLCLFLGCREMFCYHFPKCVCVWLVSIDKIAVLCVLPSLNIAFCQTIHSNWFSLFFITFV